VSLLLGSGVNDGAFQSVVTLDGIFQAVDRFFRRLHSSDFFSVFSLDVLIDQQAPKAEFGSAWEPKVLVKSGLFRQNVEKYPSALRLSEDEFLRYGYKKLVSDRRPENFVGSVFM